MCIKDLVSFIWFGGLIFDLSHFLIIAQLPQTIDLTSKVVKSEPKQSSDFFYQGLSQNS